MNTMQSLPVNLMVDRCSAQGGKGAGASSDSEQQLEAAGLK